MEAATMGLLDLKARLQTRYEEGQNHGALDLALIFADEGFIPFPFDDQQRNEQFVAKLVLTAQEQHKQIATLTQGYGWLERWAYRRGHTSSLN